MENLAEIAEPQVPQMSRKIHTFNFPSVYSVSMGEIGKFRKIHFIGNISQ